MKLETSKMDSCSELRAAQRVPRANLAVPCRDLSAPGFQPAPGSSPSALRSTPVPLAALLLLLSLIAPRALRSQTNLSVSDLARLARPSVTVISHYGRDDVEDGLGSGFVIDPDGLIATSLHVIGEARRVQLRLADGRELAATSIEAWDRKLDLAVIRVTARDLPALPLGNSDELRQGDSVVAMGNPLGLEHSIVEGVVSALREVDGQEMIQLAIPIEPGNSGGPLLDRQGRVQGILDMKSALTSNLGFAIPINLLKPLLLKPNPVPIERWLRVVTLPPSEWKPLFGARWSRRAGHIHVEGLGKGFGGRSLCLSQLAVPDPPYEIAVSVRLHNEDGAAGLIFGADGGQKHYGFYPTAGRQRLTRFEGPDVYSWTILQEVQTPYYHPDAWNWIKVRQEKDRLLCYVNDHLIVESTDHVLPGGFVGLAKFRDTQADFKNFQIGLDLRPAESPPEPQIASRLNEAIQAVAEGNSELEALAAHPGAARELLAQRIRQLEQETARFRRVSRQVHEQAVRNELVKMFQRPEDQIDLFAAALLVAKLDNPDLLTQTYLNEIDAMAKEILAALPEAASDDDRLAALRKYLFVDNGFHGSRTDYYNRANSYMNEVIDDREGLPITLTVLFIELGRRIHLDSLSGIGLPGHFIAQYKPRDPDKPPRLFDVFEGAKPLLREGAAALVFERTGGELKPAYLEPVTKRQIILRILENLLGIAQRSGDSEESLRYLDAILDLDPDNAMKRGLRAMVRLRAKDVPGGKTDLEWILEHSPDGIDLDRIADLYRSLN